MQKPEKTGWKKKKFAMLLSLILIFVLAAGVTAALLMDRTDTLTNVFKSGIDPTGELVISKQVNHPFGAEYQIPDNDNTKFTFQVDLGQAYANQEVSCYRNGSDTSETMTTDENGVGTLTLQNGDRVAIKNLPSEMKVTVTETGLGAGFTAKGGAVQEVTVPVLESAEAAFTNVYEPGAVDPVNITVAGSKVLTGREWAPGDKFVIKMDLGRIIDGSAEWTELASATLEYNEEKAQSLKAQQKEYTSESYDFTQAVQSCQFTEVGTYYLRIQEEQGQAGGMTYDQVASAVKIVVGDADMDGKLEIQNVEKENLGDPAAQNNALVQWNEETKTYDVTVDVTNAYAASPDTVTVTITKTLTDKSGTGKDGSGFCFELYDAETGDLLQTSTTTDTFGETYFQMTYGLDNAGQTFRYIVKEVNAGQTIGGMSYDAKEYQLKVSVIDNLDGTISAKIYEAPEVDAADTALPEETPVEPDEESAEAAVDASEPTDDEPETADNVPETADDAAEHAVETADEADDEVQIPADATNAIGLTFQNTYDPADTGVTISGHKTLSGRALQAGEFSFELYEITGESRQLVKTVTNSADGNFAFTLSYSTVGSHTYEVAEKQDSSKGGVTFSDAKYYVTVKITDGGGYLNKEVSITDVSGAAADIEFENAYQAAAASVSITGEKILSGDKTLEAGMFSFDLYSADESFAVQGTAIASVSNDADGRITFAPVKLTKAGTYYYVVKEDATNPADGIVYDSTAYGVAVTVTDDLNGSLKHSVSITAIDGGQQTKAEAIVFENTYAPEYASLVLEGKKTLSGASLTEGMFSFQLYKASDAFQAEGGPLQTVTNDAAGKFAFDALSFNSEGTYYYVVAEDASKPAASVTYDDTVYGVTVTVTDAGGHLTAEKTITILDGAEAKEILFQNAYVPTPDDLTVDIAVQKTVKNVGTDSIGSEDFIFILENAESGEKAQAQTDASGKAVFTMTFTQADVGKTFSYHLSEKNDGREYVTYSTEIYNIQITVTQNDDHQLAAALTLEGEAVSAITAEFENIYDHSSPVTEPTETEEATAPTEAPTEETKPSQGSGSKTGDDSNIWPYIAQLLLSAAAVVLLAIKMRRRDRGRYQR